VAIELETARLRIRPFVPEDWEAVHAYMSQPEVHAYLPEWPVTPEQAQAFVRVHPVEGARVHALVLRPDDQVIGHMAFHPWFGSRTFEIGWAVDPAHQGRGYATEAGLGLLAHGFEVLGLHRIVATCQPQNVASVRVMEKLGMRREAHFRECMLAPDGTWWDEYFFALLEEEWPARRGYPG
jgi:ribosomal-protein-alanine N-acetyltransferase